MYDQSKLPPNANFINSMHIFSISDRWRWRRRGGDENSSRLNRFVNLLLIQLTYDFIQFIQDNLLRCGKVGKRMKIQVLSIFLHPFRICIGDWIKMNEAQHMSGKTKIIEWKVLVVSEGEARTHAHHTSFFYHLSIKNKFALSSIEFRCNAHVPSQMLPYHFLFIRRWKWNFLVHSSDTTEEGRHQIDREKKASAQNLLWYLNYPNNL